VSRRAVDLLALTLLWIVLLTGAVLIAAFGAQILPLAVLWLIVFSGAVLLVVVAPETDPDAEDAVWGDERPFILSGILTVIYVFAAAVALRAGVVLAFLGGASLAVAFLLVRHKRRVRARQPGGSGERDWPQAA
jgi:hypothetical protein